MTKKNNVTSIKETESEKTFRGEGEGAEQIAVEGVAAGAFDSKSARGMLEQAGVEAAKDEGINPDHARTIIDAILAKFDSDVVGINPADGSDSEDESDEMEELAALLG